MNTYNDLSGMYSLCKTLRFELKPIGKTLENIERKGLIAQDEQRNEEYKKVKDIIDRFHKSYIKWCLAKLKLKLQSDGKRDSLEEYVSIASIGNRSETDNRDLDEVRMNLRKQIAAAFKEDATYSDLFKKELIKNRLPDFVTVPEERKMVENFSQFTTYFTGFHENRKNMYSDEEKSTAIAYRLIHENLPMFVDNMKSFAKIAESEVAECFANIEVAYEECLNVVHLSEMFQLDYFTETLTQEQITIYNNIIGGKVEDDGTKIKGINEYVNLYNQTHKDKRLPLLKPLYKMILSDRVALSWLPEEFKSDEEMLDAIREAYTTLKEVLNGNGEKEGLRFLLENMDQYDTSRIYIANDLGLTDISQQMFGQYDVFTKAIKTELIKDVHPTAKERRDPELYEKRIGNLFKAQKSFSIDYLNSMSGSDQTIQFYFAKLGAFDRDGEQKINLFCQIEMAYIAAGEILAGKHANLNQSEQDIKLIKDLLDAFKALQHFIKPLLGTGDEAEKDNEFDARLREAWNELDIITPLYNKVRNWLTRKPYSTEKIKLNFENPVLLKGWPNPEANSCIILRENECSYFLAILDNESRTVLRDIPNYQTQEDFFYHVEYLQGGDMGKNVQNLMIIDGSVRKVNGRIEKSGQFAGHNIRLEESKIKNLPPEINRIRKSGSYSVSNKNFNKEDLTTFIDYYKTLVCEYYSSYSFLFKDSCEYSSFAEFTDHINQQAYQLNFNKIPKRFIYQLVEEGKLYLFQIWNKDFSTFSKGTPNMHTLYWKMLFDEQNLADVVYKLNGKAEIFYRKHSLDLDKTTVHKAHQAIVNKNVQNEKKTSTFDYDIVKDRRYTVDKFQFHVPITINFKSTGNENINAQVREVIKHNGVEHIIGIDRGERHLLYLSLIDLKGNIVKQMTLNDIVNEYRGNTYQTNYKDLLATREGDRTDARRNWKKIENIKELKEGYLSQVVHIIAKMMVEYKAIVVLENLNSGFMRGRQKIERNVYEQFENKLVEKLRYLVNKQEATSNIGGILHAYQLTCGPEASKKTTIQNGCLFYIPAWNTSKIDPVTGFANLFKTKDTTYVNVDSARLFFTKFDSIRYNAEKDWFEFALDYNRFDIKVDGSRAQWTLCTYGTRVLTFRNPQQNNNWDNKEVNLTDEFKQVFNEAGIDIHGNLKEAICSLYDKKILEPLMHLMKLTLQMRNSVTNSEVDYLLSPVADEHGNFYDSRVCDDTLPQDADANGAYNIARKGLWCINKIKASGETEKIDLAISNKEWLNYAQQKPYLND